MLASEHFKITRGAEDDWFDPILDSDTELFVDPFLVFKERDGRWAEAHDQVISHFDRAFMLIAKGDRKPESLAYKKALDLLHFKEPQELCLGYTSRGSQGAGSGPKFAKKIGEAISAAIARGLETPSHFEELGILNKGIGSDRISDATCTILKRDLIVYTQEVARRHGIALEEHELYASDFDEYRQRWVEGKVQLPTNPATGGPLLLVPQRFLAELPLINADDWWSSYENERLRTDLNYEVLGKVNKEKIVEAARQNTDFVRAWAEQNESRPGKPYDFSNDPKGVWQWDPVTREYVEQSPLRLPEPTLTLEQFLDVIALIADDFSHFVDREGGWKLLWDGPREKHESASQLLFKGLARSQCKVNDISVDREVDLGCGTVDFKFSTGYRKRALLEVKKLENGRFWNGLKKQLPEYLESERISHGWFLVMRFRDAKRWDKRLGEVRGIVAQVAKETSVDLRVVIVDARRRSSASRD